MNRTSVSIAIAFTLTALVQPSARCAEAPRLSARFFFREDHLITSSEIQILLDDVSAYYVADCNGDPSRDPGPQHPKNLTFRILTKQPTQDVQWVSIPLSSLTSIDFQWLPMPRSMIGFKTLRFASKDGGSHSMDMMVDGQKYRYVRTSKNGVVKQDITGELELRMAPAASEANRDVRAEVSFAWFAFRGIGSGKQRPHSPDNDWILNKELINRIEFVENVDEKQIP